MRILGVDFGLKRIGLAISDETGTVAQSVGYVTGGVTDLVRVAQARSAAKIVVGLPRRLDGTSSQQTERTQAFVSKLQQTTSVPVETWDERLTSAQAERVLIEGEVRRKDRKEKIDQLAAQILLQSYLDAHQSAPTEDETFFRLTVAYDGTAYGGWQRQPNRVTVQELLEKAIEKVVGSQFSVHGSGRTDAGVHASEQVASCSLTTHHSPLILCRALNANLPEDVRVLRVREVGTRFHARFSAKGKEYRYQIDTGPVADPFQRRYAWHHPRPLDVPAMRRAARLLKGRHDFSALSANPMRAIDTPVRRVTKLTITRHRQLLTIAVRADGFLYKMVRSMVGALVKVGEGRLTVEQLRALLAGKRRTAAVETAPAHGLFLWKVFY